MAKNFVKISNNKDEDIVFFNLDNRVGQVVCLLAWYGLCTLVAGVMSCVSKIFRKKGK